MGTETQRLQEEIKALIARLGWSQKTLAGELWALDYDDDCPPKKDVDLFAERLKKQLTRPTAAPERLRHYLHLLQQHDQFKELVVLLEQVQVMPKPFRGCRRACQLFFQALGKQVDVLFRRAIVVVIKCPEVACQCFLRPAQA
ncbi:hypothetical protein HX867_33920, partial [Pseudomonas gingeri]|uniref:hypothetical protein n=1 Tax=Pseudomonas gingeri TaxID=117681 RepID=UPI0015A094D9